MAHLISGIFFQKIFDRRERSHRELRCAFVGIIKKNVHGILWGEMNDEVGWSFLRDIEMTEKTLSFSKKYLQRSDIILYRFEKKPDGSWKGNYFGGGVGSDESHCLVTEAPDNTHIPMDFFVR